MKLELLIADLHVVDRAPAARAKNRRAIAPGAAREIAASVQSERTSGRKHRSKAASKTAELANTLSAGVVEQQPISPAAYRAITARSFTGAMPTFGEVHRLQEGASYLYGRTVEEPLARSIPSDAKTELHVPAFGSFTARAKSVVVGVKLHTVYYPGNPYENCGQPWTDWRTDCVANLRAELPDTPEAVAARRLFAAALGNRREPLQRTLAFAAKHLLEGRALEGAQLHAVRTLDAFLRTHASFFEPYAQLGGSALAAVIHMAHRAELAKRVEDYMKRVDESTLARVVGGTRDFGSSTPVWWSAQTVIKDKLIRGCATGPEDYVRRIDELVKSDRVLFALGERKRASASLADAVRELMPSPRS